ncbi:MAG TPA: cytochrome b/b6 domain-containing protein, partial [Rhizomicrobium sp.]
MSARNTSHRYGTVAMSFHWTIAALIILNVVLGVWFVNFLERGDPTRGTVVNLHETLGILVLLLSLLRLGWRLMNPIPALPADFSPGKRIFARGTHYTLYALMILVPFIGWALASLPDRPLVLAFGAIPWPKIFYFANLSADAKKAAAGIVAPSHIVLAFLLFGLAVGHLCAALFYHGVIRK